MTSFDVYSSRHGKKLSFSLYYELCWHLAAHRIN